MKNRTTIHAPIHFYPTAKMASDLATANQAMDDDWTYTVIQNDAGHYLVQVTDEDGQFVHCL